MSWTAELVQNLTTRFHDFFDASSKEMVTLKEEIELAKRDWILAQNYFQNATDPDLVDHAIYMLEAAEAKYTYLLKRARNMRKTKKGTRGVF